MFLLRHYLEFDIADSTLHYSALETEKLFRLVSKDECKSLIVFVLPILQILDVSQKLMQKLMYKQRGQQA